MKNLVKKFLLIAAIPLLLFSAVSIILVASPAATSVVHAQDDDDDPPEEEGPPTCEDDDSDWVWAICPTLRMIDNFIGFVDNEINRHLSIPNTYFAGDSAVAIEAAWGRMRNIAYFVLVPVMLIMIISTALGFEFISAYTIKRALPRVVIAVIFIAVSFELCKFLVLIFNELGRGMQGLITSSVAGEEELNMVDIFSPDGAENSLLVLATVGGAAAAVGALPAILAYAVVAGLSLLIAFLLLTLRRAMVILFIILSPLAILSWIFPGNDKLWKLWWGTFWKLLAVYPLVSMLIAAGRVFAAIIIVGPNSGFFETGAAAFVLTASYAIGPLAVQRSSGAFGVLTGSVSGGLKGASSWIKGTGRKAAATRMRNTAQGTNKLSRRSVIPIRLPAWRMFGRFGGRRIGEGIVGNTYRRAALWNQGGITSLNPFGAPILNRVPIIGTAGMRSKGRYAAARRKMTDEVSKKSEEAGHDEVGGDDTMTDILSTDGMTEGRAQRQYAAFLRGRGMNRRDARRKAFLEVGRAIQYYGAEVGSNTMQTAAFRSWATSKTNDDTGGMVTPDAVADMERRIQSKTASMTGRGFLTAAQAVNLRKANKARPDQSAESWGAQWDQQEAQEYRYRHGARGAAVITNGEITHRLRASIDRAKPGEFIGADYRAVNALVDQLYQNLNEAATGAGAYAAATPAARTMATNRMYGAIAGLYDNMAYADPHVQTIMAEHVMSQAAPGGGIGPTGAPERVWDRIERLRPDNISPQGRIFHSMRREWSTGAAATGAIPPAGGGGPGPGPPP